MPKELSRRYPPACRLAVASASAVLGMSIATSLPAPADEAEHCTEDAMVVFDASGSMREVTEDGSSRIDMARAVGHRVLPSVTAYRRMGLMTFGPGTEDQCANVSLRVPVQDKAAATMLAVIDGISTDGGTPLASAVEAAAGALDYQNRPATVVVITDGDESCGRDPCDVARALHARAAALKVHVIGIDTGSSIDGICIAKETGGAFMSAKNAEDLTMAMRRTLGCPLISTNATSPPKSLH